MLHHHEAARARLRGLTAMLAQQAGPELAEAARRSAEERDRNNQATHRRRQLEVREAVARLRGELADYAGWQVAPWSAIGADDLERLGTPDATPHLVRLGSSTLVDDEDVPFVAPIGNGRHLCISESIREPQVAGLVQSVLARMLAMRPGTVRIAVHDPVGLGQILSPFQPLVERGVASLHTSVTILLDEAERFAQRAFLEKPADRTHLVVFISDLTDLDDKVVARVHALARVGAAGNVHLVLAGAPASFLPHATSDGSPDGNCTTAVYLSRGVVYVHETGFLTMIRYDAAPGADLVTGLCRALTQKSAYGIGDLVPAALWQESSADRLAAPIGRSGGDEVVVRFDDQTPHWLVGGRSGAGKTNFILNAVLSLCSRYSPDELELYLLDFKEGVSFHEFAPTGPDPVWLPHARAVGIEADREYGLAVLRHLRSEMNRRADDMKRAGVSSIGALRAARPTVRCPRTVAIVDEFQVLLSGNDAVARRAVEMLEEIARKGRSYGIHLVLASQTLAGIEALYTKNDSIFGQFALRIALAGGGGVLDKLNDAASTLVLGEAVINPLAGIAEANLVAHVPHAEPSEVTRYVSQLWAARPATLGPPPVFQGFAEQLLDDDPTFRRLTPDRSPPLLLLGRRIDVRGSTATVPLPADPGRHLAVVGTWRQGGEVVAAAVRGLARQHRPGSTRFLLAPLTADTRAIADELHHELARAGHSTRLVTVERVTATIAELAAADSAPAYLVLFGADAAGPSLAAGGSGAFRTGRDALKALVQQGPSHGVHLIGWWRLLGRLTQDVGPTAREDIGCMVALNVPEEDLQRYSGDFHLRYTPRRNRALVLDRHTRTTAPVVPFGSPDGRMDEDDE
ncbi:FtsK/SpoIIIE domain-containing protein [Jidongwangia harbinensis]|uniref:FtsK/SpoIIIE domain-containing protein n=1 Tax=Jidongwangia harbinensis TaxID=2878561 RepID=UPI001CD9C9B9|nr:FtsK/SpoIIIE domain-containing protein [Jidongwangia harbinensis]MCA2215509.1 TraM recognition domain-containing protein [Jidongwangia harbinensis]